jgi:hypothetical protein
LVLWLVCTTCVCFGFAGTDAIVTLSVIAEVFLLSYRYIVHPNEICSGLSLKSFHYVKWRDITFGDNATSPLFQLVTLFLVKNYKVGIRNFKVFVFEQAGYRQHMEI